MVYVTHDHAEAFALSHRIMVIHEGKRMACGTPRELWESPPSLFVADFLGHSNILPARLVENLDDDIARVETPLGILRLRIFPRVKEGGALHICLRGRMIGLRRSRPKVDVNVAKGILKAIVYRGGDNFDYVILVNGSTINIHGKAMIREPVSEGEEVYLEIPEGACTAIPSQAV
jgi:ABC-type Fe3+/spermidine/putrescine transport system ATPase subunit